MTDQEAYLSLLDRLTRLKGIEPEFRDTWGNLHSILPETEMKVLSAMGSKVETLEDLNRAVQDQENKEWKTLTEPILVVSINTPPEEFVFQFPVGPEMDRHRLPDDTRVQLIIQEEGGCQREHYFSNQELQFKEAAEIEGTIYLRGSLPFPKGLPLGYHQLFFILHQAGLRFDQSVRLIVCPEQCYLPPVFRENGRRAGLAISLAGLRSAQNWGIGDFGDLKELVRWVTESLSIDVVGLLPLHALSNREPHNISPYYPSSRFYRNPIYLNIPEMEEYNHSPEIREMMAVPETRNRLTELRESEKVQFEKVAALKRMVLEKIFLVFLETHCKSAGEESPRQKAFTAYMDREGVFLERFAIYCALEEHFRHEDPGIHTWSQWPLSFQNPDSFEVRAFREEHRRAVLFHKFLQWQVEVQLQGVQELAVKLGAEIGLYHDLALGVDPLGADSWAWPNFTVPGVKAGAPPDEFSPRGQEWGFCPPHGEKIRQDGYNLFAMEIRKNCHPGGALRIDHILKLVRLFWILEGQPPKEGVYVRYPFDEWIRILALESVRNKTLIIGEDLGTLPDHLRERLHQFGIFSYRLFYFEKEEDGNLRSPEAYPEWALASISTHDLPPLAGFWSMEDIILRSELGLFLDEGQFHRAMINRINEKRRLIDRLQSLGFLSEGEALSLHAQEEPVLTEELHRAVLSFLVSTRAKLAVLSIEDLFGEKKQLNLPGTTTEYPNWSRKMHYSLEELRNHPEPQKAVRLFRGLVEQSGRGISRSVQDMG